MTGFFFGLESPRRLALVRIGICALLLYDAIRCWRYAIEFYSTAGPPVIVFVESDWHATIPGPALAVLLQSALVFFLGTACLGWWTRTSLWISAAILMWLTPLDLTTSFAKNTVIGLHALIVMGLSGAGRCWSLDRCLSAAAKDPPPLIFAWPRRLLQLLVCSVYLGAAITKIKNPAFASGSLLEFSLLDDQWGSGPFGLWLSTLPHVPMLLSLATILYELLFPFLIWIDRWRWPMLLCGMIVHTLMGVCLRLGIFSPLMMVVLLVFLRDSDLDWCRDRWAKLFTRCRIEGSRFGGVCRIPPVAAGWSLLLYGVLAAASIGAGFGLQWWQDYYGVFGRRTMPGLVVVPPNEAGRMLTFQLPAYVDYVHRVQFGSRTNGYQVFGRGPFQVGQTLYVLVQLLPSHPELKLEGILIAPDGREAARYTHALGAGVEFARDGFALTDILPEGEYRVILQLDGHEVDRLKFVLER